VHASKTPYNKTPYNMKNAAHWAAFSHQQAESLFDFCFSERDVLARNRIIFPEFELFGLRTRVFLRDIEIAGIRSTQQFDDDRVSFGHSISPEMQDLKICGKLTGSARSVKELVVLLVENQRSAIAAPPSRRALV
jgi:hypothetical protein